MLHRTDILIRMGLALAGVVLIAADCSAADKPAGKSSSIVQLVIDYGDGAQLHFPALAWREGMTVLDALKAASSHPHGVKFAQKGSGSTAMVIKIADLANEGDGRNWLYSVGDKQGEVSAGIHKLQPGDAVLWKFAVYEYNE
ncbi:MAG TPA: DUF4430 domain-containing protein [Pirellulales bacterium]|jgi:hypothetical protein